MKDKIKSIKIAYENRDEYTIPGHLINEEMLAIFKDLWKFSEEEIESLEFDTAYFYIQSNELYRARLERMYESLDENEQEDGNIGNQHIKIILTEIAKDSKSLEGYVYFLQNHAEEIIVKELGDSTAARANIRIITSRQQARLAELKRYITGD